MGKDELLCVDPDASRRSGTLLAVAEAVHDVDVIALASPEAGLDRLTTDTVGVVSAATFPDSPLDGVAFLSRVRSRVPDVACLLLAAGEPDVSGVAGGGVEVVDPGVDEVTLRARLLDAMTAVNDGEYPRPPDEEARLSDLRTYPLSYEPLVEGLDRIAALVEGYFGATFSNVHVISRSDQHSVACRGPAPLDTERENSVCAYAIVADEVTVVNDLAEDERFADKDYVTDYGVKGYAGAPIRSPNGHTIGTVCILDDEPIELTDEQKTALQRFADEAADQFVLNRERYRRETGAPQVVEDGQ